MTKKGKWNFDGIIDRTETSSVKWNNEFMKKNFKYDDMLPLWVADMDFRAPDELLDALRERVDHGIFGYSVTPDSYYDAIINWFKRRHDWSIEKDWIKFAPGVVPAINFIIQYFSQPGDNIIIQEPVYYPFASQIKSNGRNVVNNQLVIKDNHYEMDFEDLEKKCKEKRTKLLILCSPHNPVGRVWTKKELTKLGEICNENNVLVIPDEIHCDLIFPGHKHIPYATISKEFAQKSITCVAPSKTFNIAGLKSSNVIIPNEILCDEFVAKCSSLSIRGPAIIGAVATEAVYNKCEEWLEELLKYIWQNFEYLKSYFAEYNSDIEVFNLEGTYLPWIDFRKLGIDPKELDRCIKEDGKVCLDDGGMFGESGKGFQRFNIACPRSILEEALDRITKALDKNNKK